MTEYDNYALKRSELLWLPYGLLPHEREDYCFKILSKNATQTKHFLFYTEIKENVDDPFKFCKLQFDSNAVVCHRKNGTNSESYIDFDEIYKINAQHDDKPEKNIPAKARTNSKQVEYLGLNKYIWKRKSNLHKVNFSIIAEISPPYVTKINQSTVTGGDVIYYTEGYLSVVIKYLATTLNFTMTNQLPEN